MIIKFDVCLPLSACQKSRDLPALHKQFNYRVKGSGGEGEGGMEERKETARGEESVDPL